MNILLGALVKRFRLQRGRLWSFLILKLCLFSGCRYHFENSRQNTLHFFCLKIGRILAVKPLYLSHLWLFCWELSSKDIHWRDEGYYMI